MPLTESKGNMYPWVTHTHNHIGGECPHECSYCYVDNPRWGRPDRYKGELRLIEKEFSVNYGTGKTIFMENCNDTFAEKIPIEWINRITSHARRYPNNLYVWQTKNPQRYFDMLPFSMNCLFGTTIETNRTIKISMAPDTMQRKNSMALITGKKFFTIEPIMDMDVDVMLEWIKDINPQFVNIGADSKGHGLPEPPWEKVQELIAGIKGLGVEIREKKNLERLKMAKKNREK